MWLPLALAKIKKTNETSGGSKGCSILYAMGGAGYKVEFRMGG